MKYQIVGKNTTITDSIRAAIEKKLGRMDKYFVDGDNVLCRAVVVTYKVGAKVEITIFTKEMDFRTEVRANDFYDSVDVAIDKLEDQMRRLKKAEEAKEEKDEVVRTKSIYLEPMSLDEAITRMEALGHSFFLYLDEEDDQISVAYKRLDGGYGVIQAENQLKD